MSLFFTACGGNPTVYSGGSSVGTGAATGESGANASGSGGTGVGIVFGTGGGASAGSTQCKTTCEPGQCGPIADGCGKFIECGGCTAPETCGGSGTPSRCGGGPTICVPKTCDELGKNCGMESDGCGGILNCWSDAAKALGDNPSCSDPTQTCVEGICQVASSCQKLTCDAYAGKPGLCGPVSDGCGGTLDCGLVCPADQICGLTEASQCGKVNCTPLKCEEALTGKPEGFCGFVPDGCGGELKDCSLACTNGDSCGGGGVADVCGQGAAACVPKTTANCGTSCGPISDGCGGLVQCSTCTAPEQCGGAGVPGVCGAPSCQPRTCNSFGAQCGSIADGCGANLVCGTCGAGSVCNANKCEAIICTPKTRNEVCQAGRCGVQSDGCSGTVDCGGCTAGNTCGGGGTPNVCGALSCTKKTCASEGANCGPISDGCGGIIASCGTCTSPAICGGSGIPSVCGASTGSQCTGLCQNISVCAAGQETRLTGVVHAPNGTQPLYNALVYVPNAALPAISSGPSCGRCQDEDLGKPIAAALTGADGSFVLKNVPAGVSFPLVVKMGKWRRVVTIPPVTKCTNVNLTVDQARLPKSKTDASAANVAYVNIPKIAMVTGKVDAIECVLRKIGLADSEFTMPTGTGRVHLYRANGANAGCTKYAANGRECETSGYVNAPLSDLFTNNRLNSYDMSVFDCEGGETEHNEDDAILRDWANRGGRVFASHYSYTYLHDNGNFADTATWHGNYNDNGNPTTGIIDKTSPKGQAFNSWLGTVGAYSPTYGSGYITINDPRGYVKTTQGSSERFVYTDAAARPKNTQINKQSSVQQYAFNTPVGAGASQICGRVLYSAFHVAGQSGMDNEVFPKYCSNAALTPQEEVLEFMLFDLSSCVSIGEPPKPPTCTPKTCLEMKANCGSVADGCGGLLSCGTCTSPQSCGGGGIANTCGNNCKQTSCGAQGANCGTIGDGCGGTLSCGTCTAPAVCGGGGTANVCGVPVCKPRSCVDVGAQCGAISDGCGSTVSCGTCPTGTVCGGGGLPNVCGAGSCLPTTCESEHANCGFVGDGCGGTVACGDCGPGEACGAGGPNQCGGACTKRTCSSANANCGFIGDGCGGTVDCGTCAAPLVCGGAGIPSQCGGACTPRTCQSVNATCGAISDGCGGVLECGTCAAGLACGGAGIPNQCGAGTCTPRSCLAANAQCGSIGDGCGKVLECGTCGANQSCGGSGTPNQCGAGGCVPRSCEDQKANCGPVADGCGKLLDCGVCVGGQTCGGSGTPSQCGGVVIQ